MFKSKIWMSTLLSIVSSTSRTSLHCLVLLNVEFFSVYITNDPPISRNVSYFFIQPIKVYFEYFHWGCSQTKQMASTILSNISQHWRIDHQFDNMPIVYCCYLSISPSENQQQFFSPVAQVNPKRACHAGTCHVRKKTF